AQRSELRRSLHIPLLPEVLHRFIHVLEHARRRLGDERARRAAAGPDDVNFLAAFKRVVQFGLDAAAWAGLAVWAAWWTTRIIMSDRSTILKSRSLLRPPQPPVGGRRMRTPLEARNCNCSSQLL